MLTYSFTEDEREEAARNGLSLNPKSDTDKNDDTMFDDAIAEIYHRQLEVRRRDEQELAG
jgi:hypothetical protein